MSEIKFWIMKIFYFPRLMRVCMKLKMGRYFVFRDEKLEFVKWVTERTIEGQTPFFQGMIIEAKNEIAMRDRNNNLRGFTS